MNKLLLLILLSPAVFFFNTGHFDILAVLSIFYQTIGI